MMEVLAGDGSESMFPIVKAIQKIKEAQTNGYDYAIYTGDNPHGRPKGVMHMVPEMIECFI